MDPKIVLHKAKHTAAHTTKQALYRVKKVAVKTGAAGPIYRATNRALTKGERTALRAKRVSERKLEEKGYTFETSPRPKLRKLSEAELHPESLPEAFSVLGDDTALGILQLPPRINWSEPHRFFDLSNQEDRIRAYELILCCGTRADVEDHIDGPRLMAIWDDLDLPRAVRDRWAPLVERVPTS